MLPLIVQKTRNLHKMLSDTIKCLCFIEKLRVKYFLLIQNLSYTESTILTALNEQNPDYQVEIHH